MHKEISQRTRNIILAAFAVYLALLPLTAKIAPLQDQMDWVLQAKIIAHPSDPSFADNYFVAWRPVPNMLGTLLIALLSKLLPIFTAAGVAYALYLILFVLAWVYLVRSDRQERPLIELLGALYALNHFFLMGFYNFMLGLTLAFFALGWLRRRIETGGWRTWLVFSLLALLTYLSHFLPFAVLGLASMAVCIKQYRTAYRRYLPWFLTLTPSLAGLVWYSAHRASDFWFHYAFHNPLFYIWYKVGPWAVASNYYPLTPTWAAWVNVALNGFVIAAIPLLFGWGLWKKRFNFSSPLWWAAAALAIVALLAPTRIYELLRPGQRLLFASLLLAAATVKPVPFNPSRYRLAALGVAVLLIWNGAWWHDATRKTTEELEILAQHLTPQAQILLLADSHFHYREPRAYREKLTDPYSYPNSINPLRYLPYAYIVEHGGAMRTLFGTGIVHARDPHLLPAVNRPWHLADPDRAGRYTHLVATGVPENLADIARRAGDLFAMEFMDTRLLVMKQTDK
ncbi:MAG: hypothetical protein ACTSXZ_03535 [Alphaproteobacteria bacterium]